MVLMLWYFLKTALVMLEQIQTTATSRLARLISFFMSRILPINSPVYDTGRTVHSQRR